MAISYNGFPASESRSKIGIKDYRLPERPSVEFPAGIADWAAPLLLWAVGEWHKRIEPVIPGYCWGWYYRRTTGGSSLSNHSSGTAVDVNAPKHPFGRYGTFTAHQRDELRKILAEANAVHHVLDSGEFYSNRRDGMHLEIATGATKLQVIAAGNRLNAPKDWWDDVTKDEAKTLIDNRIDAAIPAIVDAVVKGVSGRLAEDDSPLSNRLRRQVRTAVQAELDERA